MQNDMEPMFGNEPRRDDSTLNVDRLYSIIRVYWIPVVICVVISLLVAMIYLRYATPKYIAQAKVLVKTGQRDANGALLEELGMGAAKSNIENELEIFKSRVLMQKVIEKLHLNIQYYVQGKIITTNLYDDAPFRIIPMFADSSVKSTLSYKFNILPNGRFDIDAGDKHITGQYGDIVELPVGKITVQNNPLAGHLYDDVNQFIITIEPSDALVDRYLSNLTVELANKQVSIITLTSKDAIQQRAEDVLMQLIREYEKANIEDKNQIADGTIEFVENRLNDIGTSLKGVESSIAEFKKSNRIVNIESESRLLLNTTNDNDRELTLNEVQLRVLESLDKYLKDNKNDRRVMPATLIAQDATLSKVIEEYNVLQSNRQRLLMSYTENSPYIVNIDNQIADLRSSMLNYIASLKHGYEVAVNELKAREGNIKSKLGQVPEKERITLEYGRQQQIMQELYLFLLKKREETAISKSATISNIKIIDPARRTGGPVSPVRSRIYLMAFIVGVVTPSIFIVLKELFNNRIQSKTEIEKLTRVPILASIAHNDDNAPLVVTKESKKIIAEQFRALRTNFQFLLTGENKKVILITSSMSGEGKSFISLNLAAAIGLSGKKVAVLELDLRKPKITQALNLDGRKGFSTYAIGKAELKDIITPSGVSNNIFILPAGPVPPNPSELIMVPKVAEMFEELRKQYDYIIVDTAPVGLVTDAQLLAQSADIVLYVMREGYTYKQQAKYADELYNTGKLRDMGIILNDVKHGEGANYGYGAGNGYFDNDNESLFTRIKKLIKTKN